MPRRINGGSRGQIMPLMVFAIVPVLIFAALALDVGYWRNEQRKQQTAVDSAAIAAAVEAAVSSTASPLPSVTAARTDATSNGYTHDGINTILTVNDPPTTGNYTADATAVEVYLKVKHGGLFTGIVGQRSDWITTRAVARLTTTNSNCFVILSTADHATNFSADAVTLPACGILDDGGWSDHDTETVTATYVGVAGKLNAPSGTYPNARPTPSTIPAVDPCPTIAGCAYLTNNVPATSPCGNNNYSLSSGSATISPGVYCGGIKGHNATLTMNPGLYVLTGANGFNMDTVTLQGSGVTVYLSPSSEKINIHNGTSTLSAPTSGNYAGMLFYQSSSNNKDVVVDVAGGTRTCPQPTPAFNGVLYAPAGKLNFQDGAMSPTAVIVNKVAMTHGMICITSPATASNAISRPVLVE